MNRTIHGLTVISMVMLGLAGCANSPESLGFSQAEWQQLSDKKQQDVLAQRQKMQWTHPEDQPHYVPQALRYRTIALKLSGGRALFSAQKIAYAFKPVQVTLTEGACDTVRLQSIPGALNTNVSVCYKNYRVSIDPSPWALDYRQGSAFIYSTQLWQHEFSYHPIRTQGRAHLTGARIDVKVV